MPFKFNNNPHCFINVLEMPKDLIKDTCPLISNICLGGRDSEMGVFLCAFFLHEGVLRHKRTAAGLQYSEGKEGEKDEAG